MAVLPLLCDGVYGVAGWIPVLHDDILYVVLAKKLTTCLMEASVNASGTGMEDVFAVNVESAIVDSDLFKQLMLKAPFKAYKKSVKMQSAKWLKENLKHYMIIRAEWFRGLTNEVHRRCHVPGNISLQALEMRMLARTHMFSDFSITTHFTPGAHVYENMGDGLELSLDQLKAMPAMKVSWWAEAYQSGCVKYFDMKANDDGVLGVVSNGKYQAPDKKRKCHSYEDTLGKLMKKRHCG